MSSAEAEGKVEAKAAAKAQRERGSARGRASRSASRQASGPEAQTRSNADTGARANSGPVVLSQHDYQELMAVLQTYERLAHVDPDTTQRMRLMERMHSLREGVFNRIFPVFVAGYCANLLLFGGLILADRLLLPLVALWSGGTHAPLLEPEIILSVIAATVAQSAAFVLGMGRWLFPAKAL